MKDRNGNSPCLDPFATRLRFRTTKGLTTDDLILAFEVAGQPMTLQRQDNESLKDGGWLILKTSGFATEEDATSFGKHLTIALQVASIRRSWGVDVGQNRATSMFFKGITDAWEAEGVFARSDVHGLDVYVDRPQTIWPSINARASASCNPQPIIADIQSMLGKSEEIPERTLDATRMWNEAMIGSEPAAQAVLAIAAVEMLAQDKQWSESQRSVIQSLVESLKDIDTLSKAEQEEVAEAMRRMHRHGIGQGIRRLLASLDLMPLWKRWDELYSKRSALLHGLTYSDRGAQSTMVYPALALSGRIVLTALSRHVPNAALGIDEIMPLPTV